MLSTNLYAVGNMQSYMKNVKMTQEFEQRKANPNTPKKDQAGREKTQRERDIEQIKQQAEEMQEGNQIMSLDIKMKAGGELTPEELAYLKEKNPALYEKAMEVKEEREQFKKALKKCRTKEDVERLNTRTMHKFASEMQAVKESSSLSKADKIEKLEQIGRRMMAVFDEHSKFIQSKKYQELPSEDEERKEKKKKITQKQDEEINVQRLLDSIRTAVAAYKLPEVSAVEETRVAYEAYAQSQEPVPNKIELSV